MIIKAYAKMNLALRVNGVLDNGYHDLTMLNTRINLYDKIIIKKSKTDKFKMTPELCSTESNIAYKVYIKLKEKFNIKNSYSIIIKKHIPSGAGLGGGSADAAAIINTIIKIENISINKEELIEFAANIGADVPYCLFGNKCIVKGIGENVQPIDVEKEWNVILVSPDVSFDTKNIFEHWSANDSDANFELIIEELEHIESKLFNNLENAAKSAYSDYKLEEIKNDLSNNLAKAALMTGSGSSVFGLFDIKNKKEFNKCLLFMKNKYKNYEIKRCKTISY